MNYKDDPMGLNKNPNENSKLKKKQTPSDIDLLKKVEQKTKKIEQDSSNEGSGEYDDEFGESEQSDINNILEIKRQQLAADLGI